MFTGLNVVNLQYGNMGCHVFREGYKIRQIIGQKMTYFKGIILVKLQSSKIGHPITLISLRNMEVEINEEGVQKRKITNHGGGNIRGGWNFFEKSINMEGDFDVEGGPFCSKTTLIYTFKAKKGPIS